MWRLVLRDEARIWESLGTLLHFHSHSPVRFQFLFKELLLSLPMFILTAPHSRKQSTKREREIMVEKRETELRGTFIVLKKIL